MGDLRIQKQKRPDDIISDVVRPFGAEEGFGSTLAGAEE
jgi:hypothetical protein